MAGRDRRPGGRQRGPRSGDDWLDQFAPAAPSGQEPPAAAEAPTPLAVHTEVPGAGALPADLTEAAIREVDTPAPVTTRRHTRGDVSDWLEQFAPVADPDDDDEPSATAEAKEPGATAETPVVDAAPPAAEMVADEQGAAADPGEVDVELMVPGVEYTPRTGQPRGAIDWNAPVVWSGDDVAPTSSPAATPSAAAAAPLPPPIPAPPADGQQTAAPRTTRSFVPPERRAPGSNVRSRSSGTPAWPEPPQLDSEGVPISRLKPATDQVAWGWAAAWPNGGPAEWHTQSLPAVADGADTPIPADIPVLESEPSAGHASPGSVSEDQSLATEPVDAIQSAAAVADIDDADTGLDPVDAGPPVGFILPGVTPSPSLDLDAAGMVAWADDIPPVSERPAPPPITESVPIVDAAAWHDAITAGGDVPSPPKDWQAHAETPGAASESVSKSTFAQDLGGGADPSPTTVSYHAPSDSTAAGDDGLLGSENVNNLNDSSESGSLSADEGPSPFAQPGQSAPISEPTQVAEPAQVAEPPQVDGPPLQRPVPPTLRPVTEAVPGWDVSPPLQTRPVGVGVGAEPTVGTTTTQPSPFGAAYQHQTRRPDAPSPGFDLESPPEGFNESVRSNPATRLLIEWVPLLLGAFLLAMIVRLFAFQAYYIPSGSMIPTLEIKDRVLVNKLSYDFHDVNRGDIVVFKRPEGTEGTVDDLIKRVIGLSGETIVFQNGNVFVDGQLVEESYIAEQDSTFPLAGIPGCVPAGTSTECTVPSDSVFVLGDNRRGSTDGRVFGPVPEESIVGRAWVRVWPLTNLGLL